MSGGENPCEYAKLGQGIPLALLSFVWGCAVKTAKTWAQNLRERQVPFRVLFNTYKMMFCACQYCRTGGGGGRKAIPP